MKYSIDNAKALDLHLDMMIRLAFDVEDNAEVMRILNEPDPVLSLEEKAFADDVFAKALAASEKRVKLENRKRRAKAVRKSLIRAAEAAACIILIIGIAMPIAIAHSPAFRAKVMQLIASDIICVSAYQRKFIRRKKRVHIIPNALQENFTGRIIPDCENAFMQKRVLMLGSLKGYKGTDKFIAIAQELPEFYFELVLNESEENIAAYWKTKNLTTPQNLTVHPRQEDVVPFYNKASLVLNLSDRHRFIETFGLTALEAMTAGLPVIVPTVGGIAEMVEDGKNGYRIDVQNKEKIKELQEFISRFSANASKSKQATSRKRALEKIELEDIRPSSRKYPYIDFRPNRSIGNEVLSVEGLSKTIDGVKILDNLSFTIGREDKVAFVGGNELAKTTIAIAEANGTTLDELIESLVLNGALVGNDYSGATVTITVTFEAKQAKYVLWNQIQTFTVVMM